jgi:hypothetical protein
LVKEPETWMARIYEYIGIPFERETIDYGEQQDTDKPKGLGDPIGVQQHTRPTTGSVKKWAEELAAAPDKLKLMQEVIAQLDPDDLKTCGYPVDTLWQPLGEVGEGRPAPAKRGFSRYRLQRKLIVRLRSHAQRSKLFRNVLEKVRLTCNVLLRE